MNCVRNKLLQKTCCFSRFKVSKMSSSVVERKIEAKVHEEAKSIKEDDLNSLLDPRTSPMDIGLLKCQREYLPQEKLKGHLNYWETVKDLEQYEKVMMGVGRVLRLFVSKERYDNMHESALMTEYKIIERFNKVDEFTLKRHGPEWALGQIIFSLGGAIKLRYDDRWVEDVRQLRTPKRKDFKLECIDLRKSAINFKGLQYTEGAQYVRYFNVGDAKCFDDQSLSCLHPLSDTLEFLDVGGTAVTERGLGYLRLFPKLKYLNISRLEKAKNIEMLIPFLEEILPPDCIIITRDNVPAENHGFPIAFRHLTNPKKDSPVGNKHIGDLTVFQSESTSEVDLYQPDVVHKLWMTPIMGKKRKMELEWQQNVDKNILHRVVKYIAKAEQFKPLL